MEEKELAKGTSVIAGLKGLIFGIFGLTAVSWVITLIVRSRVDKLWAMRNEIRNDFSQRAEFERIEQMASSQTSTMRTLAFVSLFLLIVSVVLLVAYLYCSKTSITITNKRVFGKAAFGKQVDLPMDSISAVGKSLFKGIAVSTSSGTIKFVGIKERDDVYKAITEQTMERQNKVASTTTIKQEIQQSNADELGKFKELLDKGIISQEEFDAKKKQLLGL